MLGETDGQLEIAQRGRYGGRGATTLGASNGIASTPAKRESAISSRSQSPRVIGAVTLAEARSQLGSTFSILPASAPALERGVVKPDQAMSALKDCTREADRSAANNFNANG